MFPEERRAWLVKRARIEGRVDVNESAENLGVTVETIRRDLNDLEAKNQLRRVHGGAIPIEGLGFEAALSGRHQQFIKEKTRFANEMARRIEDAEAIFLDEGSTTQVFAEVWNPQNPITVVTAALRTASILASKTNVNVICLGGKVRQNSLASADPWGPRMLSDLVLDVAIIGTNGISIQHGATCPDPAVAAVKSAAIRASRQKFLLCTSVKYGFDSFVRFAGLNDFDEAITDTDLSDAQVSEFEVHGLKVTRV